MNEAARHDHSGAKMGMWLFLFTEIILFGGLFLLYAAYLHRYPREFHQAGAGLDTFMGGLNTVVLITSSLTMALAIAALESGARARCLAFMAATIALAAVFLVDKYFEWGAKIGHGIYPGSAHLRELPPGQGVFYGLYFAMTGLHGLHVLAGAAIIGGVMILVVRGRVNKDDGVILENTGLFWHLVDLVWIFLFPLFYLIA